MKNKVYINVNNVPALDKKPPRELRPKCLKCDNTIVMRTTWWYEGSAGYKQSPAKYYYDGVSYFCCRNCALAYAAEAGRKALGLPEFNNVK